MIDPWNEWGDPPTCDLCGWTHIGPCEELRNRTRRTPVVLSEPRTPIEALGPTRPIPKEPEPMSDFFAKIAAAQASGGGNYIKDGVYDLTVKALKEVKGHNGYTIVAEFHVDASAPNGERDDKGNPVEPNPPGSEASVAYNLTKHDSAAGNVKALALALLAPLGYTEAQIDASTIASLVGESNLARGIRVKDATYRKPIKSGPNAGKMITLNRWESVPQSAEEIKARRKELDQVGDKPAAAKATPSTPAAAPSASTSILGALGK